MNDDGQAGRLGERRRLLEGQDPALLMGVGHEDVAGAALRPTYRRC